MARRYLEKIGSEAIAELGSKELRSYYTRLRDIFQKQIGRLEIKYPEQARPFRKGGVAYFGKLSEMQAQYTNPEEFARALVRQAQELEKLTITRTSKGRIETDTLYKVPSLEYRRAKERVKQDAMIEALHNAGYEHISRSTVKQFGRFMDEMRKQYGKRLPDSIIMAEFFDSLKYNTKRKGTNVIVELWEEYKNNGYKPSNRIQDLFST